MHRKLQYRRTLAVFVVQLIMILAVAPGIAAACEGGGGGEPEGSFAIGASPTSVTKPKHTATITITEINPLQEGTVKEILVSGTNTSQFVFSDTKCIKKYNVNEQCPFTVTYLGEKKAEIKFVAVNLEGVGSGTASITGTPPQEATPAELKFGGVKVNTEARKSVKIKANETVNLSTAKLSSVTAFKIVSDACGGKKLEAGKECTLEVGFLPKEKITFKASLEVPFEVVSSKELGTLVVPVSGEGTS